MITSKSPYSRRVIGRHLRLQFSLLALFSAAIQTPANAFEASDLELEVRQILIKYCAQCHSGEKSGGIDYIDDLSKLIELEKIIPGDLNASRIWVRINKSDDPMPPAYEELRPTTDEVAKLKTWITTLDPEKIRTPIAQESPSDSIPLERTEVGIDSATMSMRIWLERLPIEDQRYKRFFVLNHLHNVKDPRKNPPSYLIDTQGLSLTRAAVSKTINSLSWSASITTPQIIDSEATVLAIDLRDYEWDADHRSGRPDRWDILAEEYPYGLSYEFGVAPNAEAVQKMTGTDIPWIRADWFVATALQPHNYHALFYDSVFAELRSANSKLRKSIDGKERLEQPMHVNQLYRWLGVDVQSNLARHRAHRAGFARSGVSKQQRLLERNPAIYGMIWGSYDFAPGNPSGNLLAKPIGPVAFFDEELFKNFTFKHDGSEFIFSLPNGLHGYLLTDGSGARIDAGPIEVVEDRNRTLGNSQIVNGVSCIACHKRGLIPDFKDEVRYGIESFPNPVVKVVRAIYLDRPDLDELITRDQNRYRIAVSEAMRPFLKSSQSSSDTPNEADVEPITPVVNRFIVQPLSLETMASELGVPASKLRSLLEQEKIPGLSALLNGGTITRGILENGTAKRGTGNSLYQEIARDLEIGSPQSLQPKLWREISGK